MTRNSRLAALVLACCSLVCSCTQEIKLDIIPQPQQAAIAKGHFTLDNNVAIKGNAGFEIGYLKEKLAKAAGIQTNENGKKTIVQLPQVKVLTPLAVQVAAVTLEE